MKLHLFFIVFMTSILFSSCSQNKQNKFLLPYLNIENIKTLKDFNDKYELQFDGYEGLNYKTKKDSICFKIIPLSKRTKKKFALLENADTEKLIQSYKNEEIEFYQINFCNKSLKIKEIEHFLNNGLKNKNLKISYQFVDGINKFYVSDTILYAQFIGNNNRSSYIEILPLNNW